MIKKLNLLMIIMLLNILCGWTQQSDLWTIWKSNNDTIVSYNFTKDNLKDLRIYIINLQKYKELYDLSEQKDSLNDLHIFNFQNRIINDQQIILLRESEINKITLYAKTQEVEKIKYKNKSKTIPYWFGGGILSGIIGTSLLINYLK